LTYPIFEWLREVTPSFLYAFLQGGTMETTTHSLDSLFIQLGLDSNAQAIEDFIINNQPLPGDIELYEAEFWNASQASFLKQAKDEDADWISIVDQLDAMLR
jgi:hypothetical protein